MSLSKKMARFGLNRWHPQQHAHLVALFNTSLGSLNVGDEIINDAIRHELSTCLPWAQFLQLTTHDGISSVGIGRANQARWRFVCGSNLIGGKMYTSKQWNVGPLDVVRLRDVIAVGVGWQKYHTQISAYSRWFYRQLFSRDYLHSVRDEYTKQRLAAAGIHNVINTGCPTTWRLTPEHVARIPQHKGEAVIFTLTDWRKDHAADNHLIQTLRQHYGKLYFWVQAARDIEYTQQLSAFSADIELVAPRLEAFDAVLRDTPSLDYVGTRLHGGIRALQFARRTLIIGVDNRAEEKRRDMNLPVIPRSEQASALAQALIADQPLALRLPLDRIQAWKDQFR